MVEAFDGVWWVSGGPCLGCNGFGGVGWLEQKQETTRQTTQKGFRKDHIHSLDTKTSHFLFPYFPRSQRWIRVPLEGLKWLH